MTPTDINSLVRKLLISAALALFSLGIAGCNTTAGFGEDVEAAGEAIEGKAEEKKGY